MKRSELYDRIWSTPASKLAAELGISGSRVAAICKRHGVPTPPRGYWAKLGVGKHVPKTPLPQPEADYELKLGAPPPKPSPWVAPGVLLRPDTVEETPPQPRMATLDLKPAAAWPFPSAVENPPTPEHAPPRPSAADADLTLVRAAAAELQGLQAILDLLKAVEAHAVHAPPDEARRILSWGAAVREILERRDPVAALLNHTLRS